MRGAYVGADRDTQTNHGKITEKVKKATAARGTSTASGDYMKVKQAVLV